MHFIDYLIIYLIKKVSIIEDIRNINFAKFEFNQNQYKYETQKIIAICYEFCKYGVILAI